MKELEWLEGAEAEAYATFKEAGGQRIELADMNDFIAKSPDMITIWEERMKADGMGDAIMPIVPMQREAAKSFD